MSLSSLLFSFEGRITRAEFWGFSVLNIFLYGVVFFMGMEAKSPVIPVAYCILTLYPTFAVNIKRCHDRGHSGLFVLVSFVPILGFWYLIEVGFLAGTYGPNQYGPDPLHPDLLSTESGLTAEPQQAAISPVGRLVGVFFSPKATFEDIVHKPSWLLPFAIMFVLGLVAAISLNQRMNWRDYVSQQIEKSPRASQLSAEQKEKQIEVGAKIAPISTYISVPLVPVVMLLAVTLVMWGAYSLLGGANTNFTTSLGIVSHAFVPSYITSLLFLLVIFLKPVGTVDLQNPVATNLAAFLPDDVPKWLDALCKNVDVFVVWYLLLIAIGFAAINPKKLKVGKSLTIAASVMAVYLVLRVGIAFIFS